MAEAEEHDTSSSRGLRKLRGELDFDDWALAAQARLGKKDLWDIITGARPARREVAVSANERERERRRRIAQQAFEQSQKDQQIHTWGDGPLPVTTLGDIPETRLERQVEYDARVQSGCGRWASRASVLDLHSKNRSRIKFSFLTYTLEKKTLCELLYCVYVNRAVVVQQTTTSPCYPLDLTRAPIICSRRP